MKKSLYLLLAALAALFLYPDSARSWGFWAHKKITRKAISIMPAECRAYFISMADSIAAHSIDPDLWRRSDESESNRHYIDIDMFGAFPFRELPHQYDQAVRKFGAEKINKAGIVPWRIAEMVDSLAHAMKAGDKALILRYTSAVAHYVEDVHMPLHTATNYNGQLTGNDGIHSRYERWMVEAHKKKVLANIKPRTPRKINGIVDTVFDWVLDSYVWVDNLLLADTRARVPGKTYESRKDFDKEYYNRLFRQTKHFTYLQMSRAATAVASAWLTAWEKAGKPALATTTKLY